MEKQGTPNYPMFPFLTLHLGQPHRFDCMVIINRVSMACMMDCQGIPTVEMDDVGGVSTAWQTITETTGERNR